MSNKVPNPNSEQTSSEEKEPRMADPIDLVYKGGSAKNPREIVENPAVAPQMVNIGQMGEADADSLRDDMISGDDDSEMG